MSLLKRIDDTLWESMPKDMQKEITETRMISEFCGLEVRAEPCNHYLDPVEHEMVIDCPDFLDHDEDLMYLYDVDDIPWLNLKFHTDWKWIMGVIDKICDDGYITIEDKEYYNEIFVIKQGGRTTVSINVRERWKGSTIFTYFTGFDKTITDGLDAHYKCALEYIKWYNEKKL